MNTDSNQTTDAESFSPEEQSLDQLVAKAVEAAAKGENVEQLLDVILVALPAGAKEKARRAFAAALAKRGLRQPQGDADIPSRAALSRMREALSITTRQMMERIAQLARLRPDIADRVRQAGVVLAQNGVAHDRAQVSEADLGNMAPSAATAKTQQDRASGRA